MITHYLIGATNATNIKMIINQYFNQFPWQLIWLLFLAISIKLASQFQQEATKNLHNPKMLFLLLAPLIDLAFNAAIPLVHSDRDVQLMLILLQNTLQVLALLGLAVRFSSTFAFQAGLIGHLLRRFSSAIFMALLYLFLSILLHFFTLKDRWNVRQNQLYVWPTSLIVLFVAQRTVSILHYFLYKRTILVLNDPKYHRESAWLLRKIDLPH